MQAPQIKSTDLPAAQAGACRVVVIGGVDPGGGAGLIRDVLTAHALGVRAVAVGTAWTQQGDLHRVEPRGPGELEDAVRQAVRAGPSAVKIGMVPDAARAAAIVAGLGTFAGPVVVDPVLATSRGGALWTGDFTGLFALLRRATLVTPNAPEAAVLTGRPVRTRADAEAAAQALGREGVAAVLVKGGHLLEEEPARVTDTLVLAGGGDTHHLVHPRVAGLAPRGTGCALATALAVQLGRGASLVTAAQLAADWLADAIAAAVEVDGERHLP